MAISISGLPNGSVISCRRVGDRRDDDFMRFAALARQRSRGEMKLLMRQQHRFRVAVCGVVLDPIAARAVLTHAATLVCGRSPA